MIGSDALDPSHRPGSEARAGPIGDAQVHRHPCQRHIEPAEIGLLRRVGAKWGTEERSDPFVRFRPPVGTRENRLDGPLELWMVGRARRIVGVLGTQRIELLAIHVRLLGAVGKAPRALQGL